MINNNGIIYENSLILVFRVSWEFTINIPKLRSLCTIIIRNPSETDSRYMTKWDGGGGGGGGTSRTL